MGFEIVSKTTGSNPSGVATLSKANLTLSALDRQRIGLNGKATLLIDVQSKKLAVRVPGNGEPSFNIGKNGQLSLASAFNRLGMTKKSKYTKLKAEHIDNMIVVDLSPIEAATK